MKKRSDRGIRAWMRLLSDGGLRVFSDAAGVSLVELMIAVAVLATCVVSLIAAFGAIQRGLQMSKNKTFGANLAQEQLQILGQMDYYQVLVTSAPLTLTGYGSDISYDPNYFAPTTITEGGVVFQRYTYIQQVQEVNGVLLAVPAQSPDTGLRQVSVSVTWTQGGVNQVATVNTVLANPNTVMADSIITGTITDFTTGLAISKAVVTIAENLGWRTTTNASGTYSFDLVPGSFMLMVSAPGYFTQFIPIDAQANTPLSKSVALVEISSGSIVGNAWVSPYPVISQVVASTVQSSGFDVEYIELFNPTWSTITISGTYNLNVISESGMNCTNIPLTFNNTTVNPQDDFLIANTNTFTVNGSSYNVTGTPAEVDAFYNSSMSIGSVCNMVPTGWTPTSSLDIIQRGKANTVYLTNSSGVTIDAVGWSDGATNAGDCLGTCIPMSAGGLPAGQQIVRVSSPGFASTSFGRAYDSYNNENDFAYPSNTFAVSATYPTLTTSGITFSPISSLQKVAFDAGVETAPAAFTAAQQAGYTISGVPAIGGVISANDGVSSDKKMKSVGNSPPGPVGEFYMAPVATGSWTVILSSGNYMLYEATVTVASQSSVTTLPSSATILNQAAQYGFITGTVLDVEGVAINPAITVSPGNAGSSVNASVTSGRYTLHVSTSPGLVDVTANPEPGGNVSYVAVTSAAIPVSLGTIVSGVNFVLSEGGQISGCVTRDGVNALPGIAVAFLDSDGVSHDQEITNSQLTCTAGPNFTSIIMATNTYTVEPELPTLEASSPSSTTVVAVTGNTVFSTTFTISNALATVTGSVTSGGSKITTGVLIVMTTGTLSGTGACGGTCPAPPSLSTATLVSASYYSGSSLETGVYSINVRAGSYNIYGYYTTIDAQGTVTTKEGKTGVQATSSAGQTVTAPTLAW